MPLKIFFCYAREDEPLLNKMKAHLAALQRLGFIDMWHDRNISAGTEWEREINKHLNEADIILLLISPDFMVSDYCYSKEMKWAMNRHEHGEARVVPVILRPVDSWKEAPFGKLQALPRDAVPITDSSWRRLDKALSNMTEGIRNIINEIIDHFVLRRTLVGHSLPIWSIAISPDGQTLASGSDDTTIKLWDLQTGELLRTLIGHAGYIWSLAISPDGQILASGSDDTTIKLWDLQTGELLRTLAGHSNWVKSVIISPDGQILASGSADETIKLWNLQTGKLLQTLEEQSMKEHVNAVIISPDGQILASGSADGTIRLWSLQTGKLLRLIHHAHHGGVNSIVFNTRYQYQMLISGGRDNAIRVWDSSEGWLLENLFFHRECVNSIAISSDGQTFASCSDDGVIQLMKLEVDEAKLKHLRKMVEESFAKPYTRERGSTFESYRSLHDTSILQTLTGHSNWVKTIAFSPKGNLLVSCSCDKTIKIWEKK